MSEDGRVTPPEVMRDITLSGVTPLAGKGALDTWRAWTGPRHRSGIAVVLKAAPRSACKPSSGGVYMSQHFSLLVFGKAADGPARVRTGLGKSDCPGS